LPDGLIFRIHVKPSCEKYSSSVFRKIMALLRATRLDRRGVRVVTNARRDAVDASCIARRAMQLADGQSVWSRSPDAGIKSAGDDLAGDGG
jgi:hypothetical protein